MSEKKECYEYGLIAGVLAGLIAGVLFAPESGAKSRKKLKKAVKDFSEEHGEELKDIQKNISESCDLFRCKLERKLRHFAQKLSAKKLRKAKELEEPFLYDTEMN